MPNKKGRVTGYALWLELSTRQVADVVRFDEEILRSKRGDLSRMGTHLLQEVKKTNKKQSDNCVQPVTWKATPTQR